MKIEKKISDEDLLKGAALRFSRHFPALSMGNAVAGTTSDAWCVARLNALEILDEIDARGLDISAHKVAMSDCPCCHALVADAPLYKALRSPNIRNYVRATL